MDERGIGIEHSASSSEMLVAVVVFFARLSIVSSARTIQRRLSFREFTSGNHHTICRHKALLEMKCVWCCLHRIVPAAYHAVCQILNSQTNVLVHIPRYLQIPAFTIKGKLVVL